MISVQIVSCLLVIFSLNDGVAGCMGGRGEAEKMARNFEKRMQITLMELCGHICVTEWTQWTSCTKPCGTGSRKRTRKNQTIGQCGTLKGFTCGKPLSETQRCNEGCPNGGTETKAACSCTPAWSGKCCKTQVTCPYPPRPANGNAHVRWPVTYDSVATYSCSDGFHLKGAEIRKCGRGSGGVGKWLTNAPTCTRISCTKPKEIAPMAILNRQGSYGYGSQIFYDCPHGYAHKGPVFRTCMKHQGTTGKWDGFDPTCQPVDCGAPLPPKNGQMNGTSFQFRDEITFSCNRGFQLVGSQTLKCIATGKWMGNIPECTEISCDSPEEPKYGSVKLGKEQTFGSVVIYECEDGYILQGDKVLKCMSDGEWNGTAPTCKAAICGNPGIPDYGSKDGSIYYFPHVVKYFCHMGYILKGAKQIKCQPNGKWSSPKPQCTACDKGYYMDNLEKPGICQKCPEHTFTLTKASTNRRQCVCDKGYDGPSGGPCTEIECPELFATQPYGVMDKCERIVNSKCHFRCVEGYFIDKGSSVRNCLETGEWDGKQPECTACPKDTYKSTDRSCLPCPMNSGTKTAGNMKKGCACFKGYSGPGGGPCEDIDECLENGGRGPCEDVCENRDGNYICGCSIPGYDLAKDKFSCTATNQCQNLTVDDAPENGGFVCHWYRDENSQQCSVMCNDGYEFPARSNDYETCGPSTGYVWSYQTKDPDAYMSPCIEEFFPGLRIEADAAYFTTACNELTEADKKLVYLNFKERLDNASVCMTRTSKVCNIEDMGIICGRRVRRDIGDGVVRDYHAMDLAFNVRSLKLGDTIKDDCKKICPMLRISERYCTPKLCASAYQRYLRAAVLYAKRQLQNLFRTQAQRNKLKFETAGRKFVPGARIKHGDVEVECPIGMRANDEKDKCIPCDRGTFWNATSKGCNACPVGAYQPFKNMTTCVHCPQGSYSLEPGAVVCKRCAPGFYGDLCGEKCTCVNGRCSAIDGKCTCHPGWEGPNCDSDIDGCHDVTCYPGVPCLDAPAPATGSSCGLCPPGLVGDGALCQRTEL